MNGSIIDAKVSFSVNGTLEVKDEAKLEIAEIQVFDGGQIVNKGSICCVSDTTDASEGDEGTVDVRKIELMGGGLLENTGSIKISALSLNGAGTINNYGLIKAGKVEG